tara:strand:- start:87523 stop:88581 length:1059 start_codon:yes stop_codon:yes gene_type:complete
MSDKNKVLDAVMANINKNFGTNAIQKLDGDSIVQCDTVSTGSLAIDDALGIGGLPYGRIVEIYGPESSGKTTLTLQTIAEAQKEGKICAFIDAEHALDPLHARRLGVNVEELLVSQPDTGEQALEIAEKLVSSKAVDIIVVDSVAALTPKAEIEGEMGDSHVGLQARLMSQALRKLTATVKSSNTLVMFINQIRMKIGVMFGNPETTAGGNALKFYASIRMDIRRTGSTKDKKTDEVISNNTKVKVVKNKLAPPFREAKTEICFDIENDNYGFDQKGEVIDYATKYEIINKAGAWYSYKGNKIGQGKQNVIVTFKEQPDLYEDIKSQVVKKLSEKNKPKKSEEENTTTKNKK